jgi:periplasmic copper chaperone A
MRILKFTFFVIVAAFVTFSTRSASAHEEGAHIRFAHFANVDAVVDILSDGQAVFTDVAPRDVTPYLPLTTEEVTFSVALSGSDVLVIEPVTLTLTGNGYYTAVVLENDGVLQLVLLPEDAVSALAPQAGSITVGNITITGAFARATSMGSEQDTTAESGMHGDMHDSMHGSSTPEAAATEDHSAHGSAESTAEATEDHSAHASHGSSTPEAAATEDHSAHSETPSSVVSAAYMTIQNTGDAPERLISVTSEHVTEITIHESVIENDIATMRQIESGLEIPAGGTVELRPGGMHLMLMDPHHDLIAGNTLELSLNFESGLVVTLEVPIQNP